MEDASRARTVTREVVSDVTPPRLQELIDARLKEAAMTPGVLTRASSRAAGVEDSADLDDLDRRTAGVQLIYEGLSLTRTLARSPPWDEDPTVSADMDVLVADVLVARGFFLLARTEAAPKAVETVRSFGYDETVREGAEESDAGGATLEIDIFELAIVAGVSAAGASPPAGARAFATDLAGQVQTNGSQPVPEGTIDALADLVGSDDTANSSADEVWARSGTSDT